MHKLKLVLIVLFLCNVSFVISQTNDKYNGKISEDVYTKYDKYMYTDELSYLEPKRAKIEQMRVKAAQMAIDSKKCDYVEFSDYSYYTSTKSKLEILVRCTNGAELYYPEKNIK